MTLTPALLRPYRDLDEIRNDYPVVLVDTGTRPPIASLASLIDGLLAQIGPSAKDTDVVRRDLYRLETRIKRLAEGHPGRRLATLWRQATAELLAQTADPDRREAIAQRLEMAFEAIGRDGAVLPHRGDSVRRIVEHLWRRLRAEEAARDVEVLSELIGRISDVIDAERARSPEADSPDALGASLAGEHSGGIDFEALSKMLQAARRDGGATAAPRADRLLGPLRMIESEQARLAEEAGAGDGSHATAARVRSRARSGPRPHGSCAAALEAWRSEERREVRLLRATQLATLELENRYREERHGTLAQVDARNLAAEERRALPPSLVCLDADDLPEGELSRLLEILASDVPFKVLLTVHRLFDSGTDGRTSATWPARIAAMATLASDAFVVQTAASQLPLLAEEIAAALRYEGPALLAVYAGSGRADDRLPSYVQCASAMESRAFPSFVYDPDQGVEWPSRLSLSGNPQPDQAWPRHRLSYEDAEGREVDEGVAFTVIDFLALEPRHQRDVELVPRSRWHTRMTPVADYLELTSKEAAEKVPFVYLADESDRLYRAVVSRSLIEVARHCAAGWAKLQGLARPAVAAAPAGATEAVAHVGATEAAAAPAEEAPAPTPAVAAVAISPGVAYIDTALCTSCDECIKRNARMFSYDAAKQAVIKDATAGTFRELVEAAENCPVCIIHPGKPLDQSEPGLDDLVRRAAAFA